MYTCVMEIWRERLTWNDRTGVCLELELRTSRPPAVSLSSIVKYGVEVRKKKNKNHK